MERLTKDWLAKSLRKYENKPADDHRWGKVEAVNADGSYMVRIGEGEPARCSAGCTAGVGDAVFTVVTKDGLCVALCRLGGEGGGGFSIDAVYPVGSIYMSVSETDPSTLFGGTWERLQDCFLLAAGSSHEAGETGGEESHVLTVDEMPRHNHRAQKWNTEGTQTGYLAKTETGNTPYSYSLVTDYMGGDQPHNNMPPYLAVYMWKRTA